VPSTLCRFSFDGLLERCRFVCALDFDPEILHLGAIEAHKYHLRLFVPRRQPLEKAEVL